MNDIAKTGVGELAGTLSKEQACEVLGLARSSYYYQPIPRDQQAQRGGGKQPHALCEQERSAILDRLHSTQLCDLSPRQAHTTLLDDGEYLGSPRTFARILLANGESANRQLQRAPIKRAVPMLCAVVPNDIWSWDTSPLPTTTKREFFHLYVIVDIYSRLAVDWSVETREDAACATVLFERACETERVASFDLIAHGDNGPIQRSNAIAECFVELGITKSHSRPHVSNDNPYSESLFKTAKYQPTYPQAFATIDEARDWANETFTHYNSAHYHSGIAMLTPASVHYGTFEQIIAERQRTLDAAYAVHPDRFRNGRPLAKGPQPAWINKPAATAEMEPKGV